LSLIATGGNFCPFIIYSPKNAPIFKPFWKSVKKKPQKSSNLRLILGKHNTKPPRENPKNTTNKKVQEISRDLKSR